MARVSGSIVVFAGIYLSCAGMVADPLELTDDSGSAEASLVTSGVTPEASSKHGLTGSAVIATLRTRENELTILSEGGSLRYSLVDAVGVTKSLTLDQLRAYDANLFEFVKSATARSASALPSSSRTMSSALFPAMSPEASPSLSASRGSAVAPHAGACNPGDPCRSAVFIDARVDPPSSSGIPGLPSYALPIGAPGGPNGAVRGPGLPARE